MTNSNTYRNAIEQLPVHVAPEACWELISNELVIADVLAKELPTHEASGDLWDNVEAILNRNDKRLKLSQIVRWTAAAVIVMALGLPFVMKHETEQNVHWITSEEISTPKSESFLEGVDMSSDILVYCTQNPQVCESPDFNTLNSMLKQLNQEKSQLLIMSEQLNDPAIEDYLHKINSNIAQVQRKLISMF